MVGYFNELSMGETPDPRWPIPPAIVRYSQECIVKRYREVEGDIQHTFCRRHARQYEGWIESLGTSEEPCEECEDA